MKTKGKLFIEMDCNNRAIVIFEPIAGTVWLSKHELAQLFGVSIQKVNACIDGVLQAKIFSAESTCRYDLFVRNNRIRYDVQEVNLAIILAMVYQIKSSNAEILRKWLIEQLLSPKAFTLGMLTENQNYLLN